MFKKISIAVIFSLLTGIAVADNMDPPAPVPPAHPQLPIYLLNMTKYNVTVRVTDVKHPFNYGEANALIVPLPHLADYKSVWGVTDVQVTAEMHNGPYVGPIPCTSDGVSNAHYSYVGKMAFVVNDKNGVFTCNTY